MYFLYRIQGEQENYARVNASVASAAKWYEQWPPSRETSIYVYTVLSIGTIVVTLVRSFLFFHMCVRASRKLHDNMFSSITHAKMRFFYNNTSGKFCIFAFKRFLFSVAQSSDLTFNLSQFFYFKAVS